MADIASEKVKCALLQQEERQSNDSVDEAACKASTHSERHADRAKLCYKCGKPSHIASTCRSHSSDVGGESLPRTQNRPENFTAARKGKSRQTVRRATSSKGHGEKEQLSREFAFGALTYPAEGANSCRLENWSIDFGATSHMTGCGGIPRNLKVERDKRYTSRRKSH